MKIEVVTPEKFLGDIVGDLNARRAHIVSIETYIDTTTIHAHIPLAEAFGYTTSLRSQTQGRATHSMEFHEYQELPADQVAQLTNKAGY